MENKTESKSITAASLIDKIKDKTSNDFLKLRMYLEIYSQFNRSKIYSLTNTDSFLDDLNQALMQKTPGARSILVEERLKELESNRGAQIKTYIDGVNSAIASYVHPGSERRKRLFSHELLKLERALYSDDVPMQEKIAMIARMNQLKDALNSNDTERKVNVVNSFLAKIPSINQKEFESKIHAYETSNYLYKYLACIAKIFGFSPFRSETMRQLQVLNEKLQKCTGSDVKVYEVDILDAIGKEPDDKTKTFRERLFQMKSSDPSETTAKTKKQTSTDEVLASLREEFSPKKTR